MLYLGTKGLEPKTKTWRKLYGDSSLMLNLDLTKLILYTMWGLHIVIKITKRRWIIKSIHCVSWTVFYCIYGAILLFLRE